MPTNSSGDIIDFRENAMNGGTFYSSEASALANVPSGYGTLTVDRWQTDKYLSYMNLYPFRDIGAFKTGVDWFVANGATNILIPVLWGDIFDSYSGTGKRQDQNLSSSFDKQNTAVDYVKNTYPNVKISLLPWIKLSSSLIPQFWGTSTNEKDCFGNDLGIEGYGDAHPALSDKSAGSGRSMAVDFFTKVTNYYANRLGSQFNYIIPVISQQAEYGFNYDNGISAPYKMIEGYSSATKAAFRAWLFNGTANPNAYADLTALNTAWGTTYTSNGQIEPPNTNLTQGGSDEAYVQGLNSIFASKRGVDWYLFRESMLVDFAVDCKNAVTNANNTYSTRIKFVLSFGGVSPNDSLVALRGSYDVIKWSAISDGLKTAFASDNRDSYTTLTLDYVQNYSKKIMTELHYIDYGGNDNPPPAYSTVRDNMIKSGIDAVKNGVKDLLFIGAPWQDQWYTSVTQPVFLGVKAEFLKDQGNVRVGLNGSTAINLGELLYTGNNYGGKQKWIAGGGSSDNRIRVTFTNTITSGSDADYPLSFQVKDNQRYYIKQEDIKNSYYGFRSEQDEINGKPYTTLQQSYNTTRVPILLSAFGITYKAGSPYTYSTIEIVDQSGVKWVKCVQNSPGVYVNAPTKTNLDYANNHPEYRYMNNPAITEDCRFWLPLPTSYYDVTITVYGAACLLELYHADDRAPGGIAYTPPTANSDAAGTSRTIRLSASQLTQTNVNQRVVKINNNRWDL
ncbi:hypothetical protein GCM10027442_21910 [Emticicia fontis]